MSSSPLIEWRSPITPFAVQTNMGFTGSGYNGAIPLGTTSSIMTLRLYNNFSALTGIADATNCQLAAYDDTLHQGTAQTAQALGQYMQVQVLDYNGNSTFADTQWYSIGGSTKHAIPVNSGVISGLGANYVTIAIRVQMPINASTNQFTQGVWLEYSGSA